MNDALLIELIRKIPPVGSTWPIADRHRWLRAAESVLDLLYGDNQVIEIGPLPPREETAETKAAEEPAQQQQTEPPAAPIEQKAAEPEAPAASPAPAETEAKSRPSKTRPEGIPTNINMALDAIDELGPASAQQILTWCRRKYWAEMPNTWTAVLWNFAAEGKLARAGINFVRPEAKKVAGGGSIVTVPASKPEPKPAPTPPAPVLRSPPPTAAEGGQEFEYKGRKLMLHKKEWRLATALVRAMGKGHLDYVFLVNAASAGEKRPGVGDKAWLAEMFDVLKPKMLTVGLDVIHSPPYGYSVHEVEPANG